MNRENLKNERSETNIIIRKKERVFLKGRINELGTNNKSENIRHLNRGINEFKKVTNPELII
jgi:hypothetical protein